MIKSLSDFLHAHTDVKLLNSGVQSMLIIAVDTPIEQLFADWVPESLKEFALCEITHTDVKRARVARFEQTVRCEIYPRPLNSLLTLVYYYYYADQEHED